MKFAILYSKKDPAGINIAKALEQHFMPTIPIIELKKESIYSENIDKDPRLKKIDFLVFATKHQSKAKVPSLSLHAPGNWRNADFGGKPSKLCPTSSLVLKYLFQQLNKNNQESKHNNEHQVTLEVTHHGPLINKPCCFIEIGSQEEHWNDPELAKIIAKTISSLQNFKPNKKIKTAIGIGGPHYCPSFNSIQLSKKSNTAISHILPEYNLPLAASMLEEAIAKTSEHTDLIILDWKGCGISEQRQKIIDLIQSLGLDWIRNDKVEK